MMLGTMWAMYVAAERWKAINAVYAAPVNAS
jgi:hypothetical protein